jgi:ABC-2 type transport system ATP-binding protein
MTDESPTVSQPTADAPEPRRVDDDQPRPAAPVEPQEGERRIDPGEIAVRMEGVSRRFDNRVVVRGMDLEVPRGTILGVIGPSGSGKTTTIRMLTGALAPSEGRVEVLGEQPLRFRRSTRERIGYMPQQFTLYLDLTARENVDFVGSMFGMLWPRRRRRTKEVLKLLELWDVRGKRASQLSGGMQRRLELACALVHDPTLLILDEPTAGLDPLLRALVWEELHRLRDAGRTILVTTQYVNEAEECDGVALIAGGRLIAMAKPDELRRQALGGEVIEVETVGRVDSSAVENEPGVLSVRQLDAHRLRVSVEAAATGLPTVVDAITRSGGEVASARELQVTFDEVFAELVARAGAADEAADREGQAA